MSPFLPDGLQWHTDKVALQYTINAIRFLGLNFRLRIRASFFYEGGFNLRVNLRETRLTMDLAFYAVRSGADGVTPTITLQEKEILNINLIPLFSIGPLTLELKPGLRLISTLNVANINRIYLALRNEIHVFAEITVSTPCIVLQFKLGISITGKILRIEHQFGFFSADAFTDIASAFQMGQACMELRYVIFPFTLVVAPICRVCIGFLRCNQCTSCLKGLLSSLAITIFIRSMQSDMIYSGRWGSLCSWQ